MSLNERMQELVTILNNACQAYYAGTDESSISDAQYDKMIHELEDLERQAGYQLAESPTMKIGTKEVEDKIKHYMPVLSLKDTKDPDELMYFLGDKEGVLSWKLDGVSIVLYYQNGKLDRAVSRGDGELGKDITRNVLLMSDVPKTINFKETIIIRGEGCMALSDFETLRQTPEGEKYRNPRNLASGLVNSLGTRDNILYLLSFIAHSIMFINNPKYNVENPKITKIELFGLLEKLGFVVVPHVKVANYHLLHEIDSFTDQVESFKYPVDGLVLTLNNVAFGMSLGSTARYPRDSMAFKWADTSALTKVRGMKWSVSQTGLLTPVVVFDPIELEGTTVKQASLHSLRIFEDNCIGIGDTIEVFKANKIIPEVKANLTRSCTEDFPRHCPVCGNPTVVMSNEKTRKLYCVSCGGDKLPEDIRQKYLSPI